MDTEESFVPGKVLFGKVRMRVGRVDVQLIPGDLEDLKIECGNRGVGAIRGIGLRIVCVRAVCPCPFVPVSVEIEERGDHVLGSSGCPELERGTGT